MTHGQGLGERGIIVGEKKGGHLPGPSFPMLCHRYAVTWLKC